MMMMITPNSRSRKKGNEKEMKGEYGGIICGNTDYGGMVQPSQ